MQWPRAVIWSLLTVLLLDHPPHTLYGRVWRGLVIFLSLLLRVGCSIWFCFTCQAAINNLEKEDNAEEEEEL